MDMALRRRIASGADFTHTAVSGACDASVRRCFVWGVLL